MTKVNACIFKISIYIFLICAADGKVFNFNVKPFTHYFTILPDDNLPGQPEKLSCRAAKTYCEEYGGWLAIVDSDEIGRHINEVFYNQKGVTEVLFGYIQGTNSREYYWVDGVNRTYSRWDTDNGQPLTDLLTYCYCAAVQIDGTLNGFHSYSWESVNCLLKTNYLCERPDWVVPSLLVDVELEALKNDYYIPAAQVMPVYNQYCDTNQQLCKDILGYMVVVTGPKLHNIISKYLAHVSPYGMDNEFVGYFTAYRKNANSIKFLWSNNQTFTTFKAFGNISWPYYEGQIYQCYCLTAFRNISRQWQPVNCYGGYIWDFGYVCERDKNICLEGGPNPCVQGTCNRSRIGSTTVARCICNYGYTGTYCDEIAKCVSNPCVHGNCTDSSNSFHCHCEPSYTGATCENIDNCASNPCVHGKCVDDLSNSFSCQCEMGYTGATCDDIDECASNPCVHGNCTSSFNTFTCQCDVGYFGSTCDTACSSSLCLNGGLCQITSNGMQYCRCVHGFAGYHCELSIACFLSRYPCKNNGTCFNLSTVKDGYKCVCNAGHAGQHCEYEVLQAVQLADAPRMEESKSSILGTYGPIIIVLCVVAVAVALTTVAYGYYQRSHRQLEESIHGNRPPSDEPPTLDKTSVTDSRRLTNDLSVSQTTRALNNML